VTGVIRHNYCDRHLSFHVSVSEKNNKMIGSASTKEPISSPNNNFLPVFVPILCRQYDDAAIMKQRTAQTNDAMGTESADARSVVLENVQPVP